MEVEFCIEALNEAIEKYAPPEIFNTDQGSQFTRDALWRSVNKAYSSVSDATKPHWTTYSCLCNLVAH